LAEVLSVVPTLATTPLRCAAVVRAERLVGLLSLSDVVRAMRVGSPAARLPRSRLRTPTPTTQ
jgi:CBS domain-containing protein